MAQIARLSLPRLKVSDQTRVFFCMQVALSASSESRHLYGKTPARCTYGAPVADAVCIRSGVVTEHDLVPAGPVDLRNEEVPNAEEGEVLQEQGEESADEHDPIAEFAPEPDAETEPRASQDGLPLAELSHATTSQVTETAPCAVSTDYTEASSSANGSGDAVSEREQYPVEYDPFDRPVEEVVMSLFEGDPPANTPPPKRRKGNDQ